jgi:hypothetical protein
MDYPKPKSLGPKLELVCWTATVLVGIALVMLMAFMPSGAMVSDEWDWAMGGGIVATVCFAYATFPRQVSRRDSRRRV